MTAAASADLTREQAREQVARALYIAPRINPADAAERWDRLQAGDDTRSDYLDDADAALTVLWPVVEGLRADLAHAHTVIARHVEPKRSTVVDRHCCATCETKFLDAEVERTGNPTLRLLRFMVVCKTCGSKRCPHAGDHNLACNATPCRPEAGDCCTGDAHTRQPAQGSRLPDCAPAAAPVGEQGSGRVRVRGRKDHG